MFLFFFFIATNSLRYLIICFLCTLGRIQRNKDSSCQRTGSPATQISNRHIAPTYGTLLETYTNTHLYRSLCYIYTYYTVEGIRKIIENNNCVLLIVGTQKTNTII